MKPINKKDDVKPINTKDDVKPINKKDDAKPINKKDDVKPINKKDDVKATVVLEDTEEIKKKQTAEEHRKIEEEKIKAEFDKNLEEMKQAKLKKEEEIKKKIINPIVIKDLNMPENAAIYRKQKFPKEKTFNDDVYPPDINSLCPVNESKAFIIPEGVFTHEVAGWEKLIWKRASEIFKNGNYQVFLDKIEAADIIQGKLGNCYFLSSLASLATYELLVSKLYLFQNKSNEGVYGVYMRLAGVWKLILIDDFFPCNQYKKLAFTSSNGPELWVVLLEKAWAKICGNYAMTIAGLSSEVLNCLTNGYTESISFSDKAPIEHKEQIWKKIKDGIDKKFILTSGTGAQPEEFYQTVGLEQGHAYSVISAAEIEDAGKIVKLLQIRNPWGESEWSGDWSDNSTRWKPNTKKQLNVVEQDDGVFWMAFEDFIKYFTNISICKIYTDYVYSFKKYNKIEANKMNITTLEIDTETHIFIEMNQRNKRFITKSGKYLKNQTLMHLMLLDENNNYIESKFSFDDISICIETTLPKGNYHIFSDINYRYDSESVFGYAVTTYSKSSVVLDNSNTTAEKAFKEGLISYAKKTMKPLIPEELFSLKKTNDAQCFKQTMRNAFPYNFFVFCNLSKNLTFQGVVETSNDKKNCGFYDIEKNSTINENKVSVDIAPGQSDVIVVRYHRSNPRIIYREKVMGKGSPNDGEYCPMTIKK